MKKFVSLVLALVMVLALAIPAFAANTDITSDAGLETGGNVTITGTTKTPTIKVTVPSTGAVVLNPYKMTVNVKDGEIKTDSSGTDSSDQVLSAVKYIENKSDVPISVNAKVKGTVSGEAVLATATTQGPKAPTDKKSVFMWLEVALADLGDGTKEPTWATAYNKSAANQVLVGTEEVTKANMVTMAAGNGTVAAAANGYCAFKLSGDATSAPDKAWATGDKVDVAITFTFKAVAGETAA